MPTDIPLSRDEARRRAELIRDVSYEVWLRLPAGGESFESRIDARFACTEPGASSFVDLDAASIEGVRLNGVGLPARADGGRVALPELAADNRLEITARCTYRHNGIGLHRFADPVDGHVYVHTQFEPFDAHRVYACFDQPDIKAPFTLHVHAPDAWTVVSNGAALGAVENQPGWRHFETTLPISTYITAIVAGPYHESRARHGDIDLGLFCRRSLAEHLEPDEMLDFTRRGLDFFQSAFGMPYPFGKYDQLFVPEFNWGAMENAGCVTFSEAYVFRSKVTDAARERRVGTLLHEMAHMWFGDLVTMRWWDDLWLNESFATYMSTHAQVSATRFRNAWVTFANTEKAWAVQQDQLPSTHPVVADMVDTDAVRLNFDGITYAKGASVLKQLVAWVGEDHFAEGLRDYFRRHRLGNASLADFLGALERSSGRELRSWSKQWLETSGLATLRPVLEVADGRYASIAVAQEVAPERPTLRPHRLAIGLHDLSGQGEEASVELRRRIELDVVGERTDVAELTGEQVADLLVVNDGDLTFAKLRLDARSIATVVEHLSRIADPLTRAICGAAAWDMTRDAELPARRFVELVVAHAPAEHDIGVLQRLLAQASGAVDIYGDAQRRRGLRSRLAARARAAMAAAPPASDSQLAWARAYASFADAREGLGWLTDLLAGTVAVEGLAIDTDLRWHLVECLAASGVAGDAVVEAERRRDPTDIGSRRAATALAAMPTREAKQRAWDQLTTDTSLPLATMRAIMAGLHRPGQEALLDGYLDRYLVELPRIWKERVAEEAIELTGGLYPTYLIGDATVAAADRALDQLGLPEAGRRVIAEARDNTLRAIRARAVDAAAG